MPTAGFDHFADIRRTYQNKALSLKEKSVLLCLIYHRNSRTGKCSPSQKTIAEELGLSQPTVSRILKGLYSRGLVVNTAKSNQPPAYVLGLNDIQWMNNAVEGLKC